MFTSFVKLHKKIYDVIEEQKKKSPVYCLEKPIRKVGTRGTHPPFLHQVGNHDDDACVLLPHHPPEVLEGGLERTLSSNVCLGLVIALKDMHAHNRLFNQNCTDSYKDKPLFT